MQASMLDIVNGLADLEVLSWTFSKPCTERSRQYSIFRPWAEPFHRVMESQHVNAELQHGIP